MFSAPRRATVLHIVLVEPEIAPNTGNIARLCAATGARLHLVGRLGFRLDARSLRRAGVDYWEHVDLVRHGDWSDFLANWSGGRRWLFSAKGTTPYVHADFHDNDALVFGSESHGLPDSVTEHEPGHLLTIPMPTGRVRSLNLATAAGIALYEALRQVNSR
jgi:tRNA (cytidine/uridine-2'-O-)-methyltransferase